MTQGGDSQSSLCPQWFFNVLIGDGTTNSSVVTFRRNLPSFKHFQGKPFKSDYYKVSTCASVYLADDSHTLKTDRFA